MFFSPLFLTAIALSATVSANDGDYKYVAIFSVDGLHSSDVGKYIALRSKSTIAALLKTGYEYNNAFTSAPSDSFPGSLNQFTGASPRTTGVWYDDTYDRTFFAPFSESKCHCCGPPGAEGSLLACLIAWVSLMSGQLLTTRVKTIIPASSSPAALTQIISPKPL